MIFFYRLLKQIINPFKVSKGPYFNQDCNMQEINKGMDPAIKNFEKITLLFVF